MWLLQQDVDRGWWLEHGLDGIAGGAIGGGMTALAVVLTLRHERSLMRTADLRRVLAEAHGLAAQLEHQFESYGRNVLPEDRLLELSAKAFEAGSLSRRRMAVDMFGWASEFRGVADPSRMTKESYEAIRATVVGFRTNTGAWLRDGPRAYRKIREL